jgi:hypothetical protein
MTMSSSHAGTQADYLLIVWSDLHRHAGRLFARQQAHPARITKRVQTNTNSDPRCALNHSILKLGIPEQ